MIQSRALWYKSEAERNTALGCFAVSPPCPSLDLCFHRKVAELHTLIMPYGNAGEKLGNCCTASTTLPAEIRAHECCSISLFGTWFSKVSFPSWWQPAPHHCRLLPSLGLWASSALALQAAAGGCWLKAQGTVLVVLQLQWWHSSTAACVSFWDILRVYSRFVLKINTFPYQSKL